METLRQVGAVLFVFALLGAAVWTMRKRGTASFGRAMSGKAFWRVPQGRDRALTSIERLALTPQHSLHLVRIGGRDLLVATHPQGCGLLTELRTGDSA